MSADAGSQYTSTGWIMTLTEEQIKISMGGWGWYLDNIFIKQLRRSLKHKTVYFHQISDDCKAKRIIGDWIKFYNSGRCYTAAGKRTPDVACFDQMETRKAAGPQKQHNLEKPQTCHENQKQFS